MDRPATRINDNGRPQRDSRSCRRRSPNREKYPLAARSFRRRLVLGGTALWWSPIGETGLLEDRAPGAAQNEIGKGARDLGMRCGLHDRKRIGDAIGQRSVARKRNEAIGARDSLGAVEKSDTSLARVDARQQVLFGKNLRWIFVGTENPLLAVVAQPHCHAFDRVDAFWIELRIGAANAHALRLDDCPQ